MLKHGRYVCILVKGTREDNSGTTRSMHSMLIEADQEQCSIIFWLSLTGRRVVCCTPFFPIHVAQLMCYHPCCDKQEVLDLGKASLAVLTGVALEIVFEFGLLAGGLGP